MVTGVPLTTRVPPPDDSAEMSCVPATDAMASGESVAPVPTTAAGEVLGDGNDEPAEPVGAEIGLRPLGDELVEPGLGAVAVEHLVGRSDRRAYWWRCRKKCSRCRPAY